MKLSINENIRKYRKMHNLTQEQLAEAVGVSVGAVSKWESSLSNPDISLLPVLADFFDISVDVLLGYQFQYRTSELSSSRIKEFRQLKHYEEGQAEAEKALVKFPNSFDVVYQSAVLFHMKGVEKMDPSSLRRSHELYQRSCSLISQNTDSSIGELSIQVSIGNVFVSLNEIDKALEHLKKYNFCGINNSVIGYMLAQNQRTNEALPYLSDSFLKSLADLFRTVSGLSNCFVNQKNYTEALEILHWLLDIIKQIKLPNIITYMSKAEVVVLTSCAYVAKEMKDAIKAEEYLTKAYNEATLFDANPDFNAQNIRFYHGNVFTLNDDFGETAIKGIMSVLDEEPNDSILIDIWRKITNEANSLFTVSH